MIQKCQILNQNLILNGRSLNVEGSADILNVVSKMSLTISTSLALQSLTALCNVPNTEIKYSSDKTI